MTLGLMEGFLIVTLFTIINIFVFERQFVTGWRGYNKAQLISIENILNETVFMHSAEFQKKNFSTINYLKPGVLSKMAKGF